MAALAAGPHTGPLRDDRLQLVVLRRLLDHHLAADGEPEPADPPVRDVGPCLQVVDRRRDVAVALPAEQVRVTFALALAAPVEEEHAVAVAREQPRGLA